MRAYTAAAVASSVNSASLYRCRIRIHGEKVSRQRQRNAQQSELRQQQREINVDRARKRDEDRSAKIQERIIHKEMQAQAQAEHAAQLAQRRREIVADIEMQAAKARQKIAKLRISGDLLGLDVK